MQPPSDEYQIKKIIREISGGLYKNQYRKGITTFVNALNMIINYTNKDDSERYIRCQYCGICQINDETIALNVNKLKNLLGRSKSSINQCFNKYGYYGVSKTTENFKTLVDIIPNLGTDFRELKKWSIRVKYCNSESNSADISDYFSTFEG